MKQEQDEPCPVLPTCRQGNEHGELLLGFGSFIRPDRSCSLSAFPGGERRGLTLSPSSCSHGSAQIHGVGLEAHECIQDTELQGSDSPSDPDCKQQLAGKGGFLGNLPPLKPTCPLCAVAIGKNGVLPAHANKPKPKPLQMG